MSQKRIKIAVDGYSSCGKSTLARQLAKKLGYIYLDSGAMYRAVTLFALQNNIIGEGFFNQEQLIENIDKINIHFEPDEHFNPITFLNGKNIETEIRKIKVSSFVSPVSTVLEVRQQMVIQQKKMGDSNGIVMDGRDIGTVVFPDAELKLFITADIDIRAQRRFAEIKSKGQDIDYKTVKENLAQRDFIDKSRKESPLRQAENAILIDNSKISIEEQLEIAFNLAKKVINEN